MITYTAAQLEHWFGSVAEATAENLPKPHAKNAQGEDLWDADAIATAVEVSQQPFAVVGRAHFRGLIAAADVPGELKTLRALAAALKKRDTPERPDGPLMKVISAKWPRK